MISVRVRMLAWVLPIVPLSEMESQTCAPGRAGVFEGANVI
jgi:hypothetical protein